jgi:multisubunit Na+/H+ antiporter MnhG subunit
MAIGSSGARRVPPWIVTVWILLVSVAGVLLWQIHFLIGLAVILIGMPLGALLIARAFRHGDEAPR